MIVPKIALLSIKNRQNERFFFSLISSIFLFLFGWGTDPEPA